MKYEGYRVLVFCRDIKHRHFKLKKCVFFVDEPVVMFQRNVFLTLEEEMNVSLTCLSMKFIYDICFKICVKELLKKLC